jgi:DNA-binding MarR family transcriptional regulator
MDNAHLATLYDTLRSISQYMDIHSRSLHKQVGVTAPQLSILMALAAESPLPVLEISKRVHLSAATISTTTDRLVKNGLIERQKSLDDRRKVYLRLTAKGQDVLASGSSPLPSNFIANFDHDLPDWEKSMILCALLKLTHLMRANGGRP